MLASAAPFIRSIRQIPTVYRYVGQCRVRYLRTDSLLQWKTWTSPASTAPQPRYLRTDSLLQWKAIAVFSPLNFLRARNDVANQGGRRLAHWLTLALVDGLNVNVVKSRVGHGSRTPVSG